jgi:hypothetical protein
MYCGAWRFLLGFYRIALISSDPLPRTLTTQIPKF